MRIKHLGKWKFSNPLQILHAVRHSGGMHKNALFKGRSTLVAMVTTAACSRPGASFSYKNVAKKEWNVYFSISSWIQHYKLALLPYIVTSLVFTLTHSIFPGSECEHTNRLFISVQFRSFLLSGKTGKTFIWISPKVYRFLNRNYPPSWLKYSIFLNM